MMAWRLLIAALATGGALGAPAASAAPGDIATDNFAHAQQLVAIDGPRRLNLFCVGTGAPTVVFEAGSGDDSSSWLHVQGQVGAFTRACAYDRAGFGFSDPPGRAVDAANVTDDLQRLVVAAPIATPIVLVGHSLGGMYATLFAASHKDEVAGMVLVDPSFAHQFEQFAAQSSSGDTSKLYGTFRGMAESMRACLALLRSGALQHPTPKQASDCLPSASMPEHPDAVLLAALARQWSQPAPYEAIVSEVENFIPTTEGGGHPAPDDTELDAASGNLGSIKLVVLTAGRTMADFPGLTDAQRVEFAAAWKAGHDALAQRSTRGENVMVPDSGHYIQVDQPAVVIDAIRRVVDAVRAAP